MMIAVVSIRRRFIEVCRYYYRVPKRCLFINGLLISNPFTELVAWSMLMTYLTEFRGEKPSRAAATVNILETLSGVLSLPAGFLKNKYFGFMPMITLTSVFTVMGLLFFAGSAALRGVYVKNLCDLPISRRRRIPCHFTNTEGTLLFIGLTFLIIGKTGSSTSCVEDFLEKQMKTDEDNNDERDGKRTIMYTSLCQATGIFLGSLLLKFVSRWWIRYMVCALVMLFGLIVFSFGQSSYLETIEGTIHYSSPPPSPPPKSVDEKHKKDLQNIYKVKSGDDEEMRKTKILSNMFPMCLIFLTYGVLKSTGSTFFLDQGENMNQSVTKVLSIPFLIISTELSRFLFKRSIELFVSNMLSVMEKIHGLLIRIGLGLIFSIFCCATSQVVEVKRLGIVVDNGLLNTGTKDNNKLELDVVPMNVYWLLPQFILLGAVKGLGVDGMEAFFEAELPKSLKIYAAEFTKAVTGIATLLTVVLVAILAKASRWGGGESWFADSINWSRMDHYYRALTVLCLFSFFCYGYVSTSYMGKRRRRRDTSDEEQEDNSCNPENLSQINLDLEMDDII